MSGSSPEMDEPELTSYLHEEDKELLKGYGWEPPRPDLETTKARIEERHNPALSREKLWHERRQDGTTTVTNYDPALRRQEVELQLEIARRRNQEKRRRKEIRQRARAELLVTVLLPVGGYFAILGLVVGMIFFFIWALTPSPADAAAQQATQVQQDKICKAYDLAWNAPPGTDPAKLAQLAQIQSAYNQYCAH